MKSNSVSCLLTPSHLISLPMKQSQYISSSHSTYHLTISCISHYCVLSHILLDLTVSHFSPLFTPSHCLMSSYSNLLYLTHFKQSCSTHLTSSHLISRAILLHFTCFTLTCSISLHVTLSHGIKFILVIEFYFKNWY